MLIFFNEVSAQTSCKCDIVLFIYLILAHRAYVNFRKLYPLCKNSSFPWSAKPGKYSAKLIFTNMFEYVFSRDANVHLCL